MSKTKYDKNHGAIVRVLKQLGFSVCDLASVGGGCPDLMVGLRGVNCWAEVKTQEGSLEPSQIEFAEKWRGDKVHVMRTTEDCIALRRYVEGKASK